MVKILPAIFLLTLSGQVFAGPSDEITHLLTFVEKTECSYHRNGSEHNGNEARQHIQKKYDYYRDDIKTAEDFIAYSATKSLISGQKYTIACVGEKVQFSDEWLKKELNRYRSELQ